MDFSSTAAFLAMLADTIEELKERDLAPKLSLLRFVASKVDENKSMQKGLLELMRQLYGNAMLRTPLKDSAEIDNATARLMSVYEMDRPRSEEHTSELQSLMRISYAVFCLKKKKTLSTTNNQADIQLHTQHT